MVVICPRCNKELEIKEENLRPRNILFQCTKCKNIFVLKKPQILKNKIVNNSKILIAHSNLSIINKIVALLRINGYKPLISHDGIDAIIKSIKEHPFLTIIEDDLPKINGFKVYKRLKTSNKTKNIKFLFIVSSESLRDTQLFIQRDTLNYIKESQISTHLLNKIDFLKHKSE